MKKAIIYFIFLLLSFQLLFAQESSIKPKENSTNGTEGIEAPQVVEGDVTFTDGTNQLIRITDEGDFGAIQLQNGVPDVTDFKIYRDGTTLYFNGDPVGSGISLQIDDLIDASLEAESSYYLGSNSGTLNSLGEWNTGLGYSAIDGISDGDKNTGMGAKSLALLSTGSKNTALGFGAGYHALGDGNIFLGYEAGFNENGSNKLYIDNSATSTPLIWGDFENDSVIVNGRAHITTSLSVGSSSVAGINNSIVAGNNSQVHGASSITVGDNNLAWGFQSAAFGLNVKSMAYLSTVLGRFNIGNNLSDQTNWVETDALFEIGNGIDDANRSNAVTVLKNGNVGFGPSSPTSSLHVDAVNGVLFDGVTTGSIPVEGSGSRMMWYQGKSAFRAGSVQTQWDDANIGSYSTAINYRTTASGTYSFATGYQTEASGQRSTAMGSTTIASGLHSTALGSATEATGNYSTALGRRVKAEAIGSFIVGDNSPLVIQNTVANSFMARFDGGYKLYSDDNIGFGAELAAGATSWSVLSDSTKKENFRYVDGEEVLEKISHFNLRSWNYIGQDLTKFRHYGPMAQEFYNAFGNDGIGTIGNDTTIASADFDGINLIAIQALEKRSKYLVSRIQNLESRIKDLENKNEELVKINAEYRAENAEFRNQNLELYKNIEKIKEAIHFINKQSENVKIVLSE